MLYINYWMLMLYDLSIKCLKLSSETDTHYDCFSLIFFLFNYLILKTNLTTRFSGLFIIFTY